MTRNTIFIIASIAIIVMAYFMFFKNKKAESSWKPEFVNPKDEMKSMMGMGNYGSVLGCEHGKCY